MFVAAPASATVSDITPSDVTTRAFSVVWASDEAVTGATVRVYAESAGTTDLTGSLSLTLVSQAFAPALDLGIVKMDISGLAADTCYYVQTETTGQSGTVFSPAAAPFTEVCTMVGTAGANASAEPLVNDLLGHDLLDPDGISPGTGTLVLLSAPGTAAHPISAFVGQDYPSPTAAVELNNLFDPATKITAELTGGEVLQITEFRGLLCPGLQDHLLTRFGRAPAHGEIPAIGVPIVELEAAEDCFFADTYCDDTIDIMDVQRVLNALGGMAGDCRFNSNLDTVADLTINVLDLQSVLNRFGQSAPFAP